MSVRIGNTIVSTGTPGNGTITIKQGNVTKGSFTVNQNTNSTINLDASGGSYIAGTGIDITDDVISVASPTLTNTATGTNSLTILGNPSPYGYSTNIGTGSQGNQYSVIIGYNATTPSAYTVGIGTSSRANGGWATVVGTNSEGYGQYTTVLGSEAKVGSVSMPIFGAIQIGKGTNSEAGTLSVGLSTNGTTWNNYKLLDSDGKIPDDRLNSTITGKSTVSVSATGTSTSEVKYITIDGIQKKIGGGSEEDNLSITKNSSNKIQTVGVIDQHNTSRAIKKWIGTRAEYEAIASKDTNTEYTTTDDGDLSLPLLQTLYPVGSVYMTFNETCPLANLFGTWQKVGAGRVLQGADSTHLAGSTIEAGLPNITGSIDLTGLSNHTTSTYNSNDVPTSALYNNESISAGKYHTDSGNADGYNRIRIDASRSNTIYGGSTTVQPPAICINIFRRTA